MRTNRQKAKVSFFRLFLWGLPPEGVAWILMGTSHLKLSNHEDPHRDAQMLGFWLIPDVIRLTTKISQPKAFVSDPVWVLGTELGSSGRAATQEFLLSPCAPTAPRNLFVHECVCVCDVSYTQLTLPTKLEV